MIRFLTPFLTALCLIVGCSRGAIGGGPKTGNRADALAAFAADIEPEAQALLDKTIYASPMPITWTAAPLFGMQESANPMSTDNPYVRQDRVLRQGTLPDGAEIIVEGLYSYKTKKIQSVNLIIDYEETVSKKTVGNVPIDARLLNSVKLSPTLISALLAGLGNGSTSSSQPIKYQAAAEIGGKRFEATTAVHRGKPLRLELTCMYFR